MLWGYEKVYNYLRWFSNKKTLNNSKYNVGSRELGIRVGAYRLLQGICAFILFQYSSVLTCRYWINI